MSPAPAQADCTALSGGVVPFVRFNNTNNATYFSESTATATALIQGSIVYDAANSLLKVCDGTAWQSLGGGGGGSQWVNGTGGAIYYNGGNVGIGTTGPATALQVNGASNTTDALTLRANANNGANRPGIVLVNATPAPLLRIGSGSTDGESWLNALGGLHFGTGNGAYGTNERLTILTSGNVGIGTTSPGYLLDVSNSVSPAQVRINANYSDGTAELIYGESGGSALSLSYNGSANRLDVKDVIGNLTIASFLRTTGNVGIGTTAPNKPLEIANTIPLIRLNDTDGGLADISGNSGHLSLLADPQNTQIGSRIALEVDGTERVRIDATGNVGIGTTVPTNLLSLGGDAARTIWMERSTAAAAAGNSLTLQAGGTKSGNTDQDGGDLVLSSGTATGTGSSNITFKTVTAGTTGTADRAPATAMTILGNGNVGIGTTTPLTKLQVGSSLATNIYTPFLGSLHGVYSGTNNQSGVEIDGIYNPGSAISATNTGLSVLGSLSGVSSSNSGLLVGVMARAANYASGTLNSAQAFNAQSCLKGSTGPTTNCYAFVASDQVSGTNNYGFTGFITPGSNKYEFYAGGGATNYFSGNVGIGTATPNAKLEVNGAIRAGGAAANASMDYYTTGGSLRGSLWTDGTDFFLASAGASAGLIFRSNSTNRAKLDSNGNLGLGTTAPQSKLDVAGGARVGADAVCNASKAGMLAWNTNKLQVCTDAGTFTDLANASGVIGGSSQWVNGTGGAIYYNGGNVGIGTTNPGAALDIASSAAGGAILIGADQNATTRSANVRKIGRIVSPTYDNSGNTMMLSGDNTSGRNGVYFGGYPAGSIYAATYLSFLTGSTATTTGGTERMVIDSSGNVGIGTTMPANPLHVYTPASSILAKVETAAASDAGVSFKNSASEWQALIRSNGRFGLWNSTELFTVLPSGNVGIGTSTPSGTLHVNGWQQWDGGSAQVRLFPSGDSSYIGTANAYKFNIRTGAADRMTFDTAGNVGIGTASPLSRLHIKSTGTNTTLGQLDTALRLETNTTTSGAGSEILFMGHGGTDSQNVYAAISAPAVGNSTGATGNLVFSTKPDHPSAISERMRIDRYGNVGIGTTSPAYKLDIAETQTSTAAGSRYLTNKVLTVSATSNSASTFVPDRNYLSITGTSDYTGNLITNYSTVGHNGTGTLSQTRGTYTGVYNNSTGVIADARGYQADVYNASTNGSITVAYGATGSVTNAGTSGVGVATGFGGYFYSQNAGTGSMTNAYGVGGTINNSSSGAITNTYGLYSSFSNSGGGTVTNWYGLYVTSVAGAAPTGNRFPVYIADAGNNYFAGNIGIGTTTPNQGKLEVKGGTVCVDTDSDDNATSCIANESDARLKKNVQDLSLPLDAFMKLRPVAFDWKYDDAEVLKHYPLISRFASRSHSVGMIAQEVQKIVPEAVESETLGDEEVQYLQLDYTKLVPVVIKAVQDVKREKDAEIESLKAQNADLTRRLEVLERIILTPEARRATTH